ncbi:MAG: hypothetical protein H0Z33_04745 [Bacillaceae bacterium]|nr:hypothetical protein [Bacillaceae bacterium]
MLKYRDKSIDTFLYTDDEQMLAEAVHTMTSEGFSGVRSLIYRLKQELEDVDEPDFAWMDRQLEKGRKWIPDPETYSPSWKGIWDVMEQEFTLKKKAYDRVPPADREGEWQIVINNPFSTEGVICHTDLTFPRAAYLFGHFRRNLHRHELIKFQKAMTVFRETGEED